MVMSKVNFYGLEACRAITLVLSTLQENDRLLWTQLNTAYSVRGEFFFLKTETIIFLLNSHLNMIGVFKSMILG